MDISLNVRIMVSVTRSEIENVKAKNSPDENPFDFRGS